MNTTLLMWLGVAFLGLGIAAVILQAWLWRFPMAPDPSGRDPNGVSTAPRSWTLIHRVVGLAFVVIYVIMMIAMVPRLWQYQVELPARTVVHATMGISIGFLLVVKISIIRWFQHFGKALPFLGSAILLCTIILATLSVPYPLRAHGFGDSTSPENLARVERLLTPLELDRTPAELATPSALAEGRATLTSKCTFCHDLRTVLRKPYAPEGWKRVVDRMAQKPQLGEPLEPSDLAPVVAYLVAITPDIQLSAKQKRETDLEAEERRRGVVEAIEASDTDAAPEDLGAEALSDAKSVFEDRCSQCHELDNVRDYSLGSDETWRDVVERMVTEQEAEVTPDDATAIVAYLEKTGGK